jgi:hypothetical protein
MDKSTVVALVWAWLAEHPEHYCSYVNPFTQLRWSPQERRMLAVRVGGHWRRLAQWARVVPALNCVCHFERLVKPRHMGTPVSAHRERWSRDGAFIPRLYRVLVWT